MIDILLASYNGEKYIGTQLDSILSQKYQNFRVLIRDDGSTDNTLDIIESYVNKYPEKIILIKDNDKCGNSASNFIKLTSYATSDYVMYSDQDDFWLPEKLKISLDTMLAAEKEYGRMTPLLIYCNYAVADKELNIIKNAQRGSQVEKKDVSFNELIVQNYVTGCLIMANKALYSLVGEYDSRILMHDWWLALIASSMGKIIHNNEIVMLYRQHGDNVVGNVNVKSWRYRINKIVDKNTKYAKYLYYNQMDLFLCRYSSLLSKDKIAVVNDFLSIYKCNSKFERIKKLINGNYLKSDFFRRLGQIWYI